MNISYVCDKKKKLVVLSQIKQYFTDRAGLKLTVIDYGTYFTKKLKKKCLRNSKNINTQSKTTHRCCKSGRNNCMEAVGRGPLMQIAQCPRAVDKWLREPTAPVAHDPLSCRGVTTGKVNLAIPAF